MMHHSFTDVVCVCFGSILESYLCWGVFVFVSSFIYFVLLVNLFCLLVYLTVYLLFRFVPVVQSM
jgi:hypothetical protein